MVAIGAPRDMGGAARWRRGIAGGQIERALPCGACRA
jgi:hypothetical protein